MDVRHARWQVLQAGTLDNCLFISRYQVQTFVGLELAAVFWQSQLSSRSAPFNHTEVFYERYRSRWRLGNAPLYPLPKGVKIQAAWSRSTITHGLLPPSRF